MTDRARICVHTLLLWLCAGMTVLLLSAPAYALSPDLRIAQFYHTAWSAKEGAPTGIQSLAQSTDGYLWMGTFAGLFRFDGVHFERIDTVHNQPLPSTNVYTVWAPASGGLWVGYAFGGASFISHGRITNYGEREGLPGGTVQAFAQDGIGTVWMATTRGLKRFDGSRWIDVSTALGLPNTHVSTLNFDRSGTLWIAVGNSIMFLQPGQHALTTTDIQLGGYVEFHESPDGTLWLMDDTQGARALYVAGAATNASKNWIRLGDSRLGPIEVPFIDSAGTFWMSTPTGIRRLRDPAGAVRDGLSDGTSADAFVLIDGLTGLASTGSFSGLEDREGNVWLGTAGGLHRFRESRLTRVDTRVDVASNTASFALAAGDDGAMLVGEYSKNGAFKVLAGSTVEAMPGPRDVTCAYRDPDGTVWFGGREGIWRFSGQRWVAIDLPVDNLLKQRYSGVQAIAKERSGALWVSVGHAVFRQVDGKWSRYGEAAVSMAADSEGRVWLGYPNNQVQIVDKDTVRRLSAVDGLNVGAVLSIDAGPGHVWVGGDHGLARFDGRRFNAVTRQGGTTLRNVSGIIETAEGDLWLSTSEGAVTVPADEVRRVVSNPLYAVRSTLLDFLDGMPGAPSAVRPLPTMAEDTDGRLWFATSNGIAWTYPRHVARNAIAPTIDLQSIVADGVRYEPSAGLKLPIRTRNLQISYTALSLSIPERVKFRYQLGAEQPWQDVGGRREAYFNDLPPGHYNFRVIASNNDGVWNETGAVVDFTIPPAFVQTKWFLAICVAAGMLVLWLLWTLRLQQVHARMRDRLEQRALERERIAQELHDTLLQGLLSASLQLEVANSEISPGATAKPLVERVFQQLRQMVDEGRNAVRGLRTKHSEADDLEHAFSQIPQDLVVDGKIQYRLIVEGAPRSLRPTIRDEVYRIGREALANAFHHSSASFVETVLDYSRDRFRMVVRDNGRGMDPEILRSGREGHWGLSGMQERSKKIGASLKVQSAADAGTEIDLIVPAAAAFEPAASSGFVDWLAGLYLRGQKK
jgi:signal transduction histidine kinase